MTDQPDEHTRQSRRRRSVDETELSTRNHAGEPDDATVLSSRRKESGPDDATVLAARRQEDAPEDATVLSARRGERQPSDATVLSAHAQGATAAEEPPADLDDTVVSLRPADGPAEELTAQSQASPRRAQAPQGDGQTYRARSEQPVRVHRAESAVHAPVAPLDPAAFRAAARRRRTRAVVAIAVASLILIGSVVALIVIVAGGA